MPASSSSTRPRRSASPTSASHRSSGIRCFMAGGRTSAAGPSSSGSPSHSRYRMPVRRPRGGAPACRIRVGVDEPGCRRRVPRSNRPGCRLDRVLRPHAVLQPRWMDLHAVAAVNASRITSERVFPSRVARASRSAISSTVRRNATTCEGSAPRPGLPRPRFFNDSTSNPTSASADHAAICSSVTGSPLIVSSEGTQIMYDEFAAAARSVIANAQRGVRVPIHLPVPARAARW